MIATAPRVDAGAAVLLSEFSVAHTILVVESYALARDAYVELLRGVGHRVLWASCARSALRIARTCSLSFDLVLTDVRLPDADGRDLVELVGRLQSLPPRGIYITCPELHAELRQSLSPGDRLFAKPVSFTQLAKALDALPAHTA